MHAMQAGLVMAARIVPAGGWQSRLKPVRTPRVKNDRHRQFVKSLPCICCLVEGLEIQADDPMHLRDGSRLHGKEPAGAGETSDDRWVLPGCRPHHNGEGHLGNEGTFWRQFGIDPFLLALVLWGLTGRDHEARLVLREHAARARAQRGSGSGGAVLPDSAAAAPAAS